MEAVYEDTINTPRHRFDPTDKLDIPKPDRTFGGVVMNTIAVTCEFWKDWPGHNWSTERVERQDRSIYFTHLPNYLCQEAIEGIFGILGEWEAIEVHKHSKSRWAFGFVRFTKFATADNALRTEVYVEVNGKATTIGYGQMFCCVRDIKDGFNVVKNSDCFMCSDIKTELAAMERE